MIYDALMILNLYGSIITHDAPVFSISSAQQNALFTASTTAMSTEVKASVVCPGFMRMAIFDTSMDVSGVLTEKDKKRFFEQFKMITPE
ncbi:MAG: hypothetical protein JW838_08620 [Spirochaetes bacterium]|nr:hypothetical protein [Spirochaetota bacterium]